jgi:hypothetical protein
MSNENFEVIFAGQIVPGAELEQVKTRVAVIFKTDVARIAHLFSGSPVVIKKGIDQQMAQKYQAAMQNAGAICEIRDVSGPVVATMPTARPAVEKPVVNAPAPAKKVISSNAPPAPQTAPLHITADKIAALQAGIAPVGSDLNQAKQEVSVDMPDISGLSMAPAGTVLSTQKKETPPPPPDTSGLSIVKN